MWEYCYIYLFFARKNSGKGSSSTVSHRYSLPQAQKESVGLMFNDMTPIVSNFISNQNSNLLLMSSPLGYTIHREPFIITPSMSLLFACLFHMFGSAAKFSLPICFPPTSYLLRQIKTFSCSLQIALNTQLGSFVCLCVALAKEICFRHFRLTFLHCSKNIQPSDREHNIWFLKFCLEEMIKKVVYILFNLKEVGILVYKNNISKLPDFGSLVITPKWHQQWEKIRQELENFSDEEVLTPPLKNFPFLPRAPAFTPCGVSLSFLVDFIEDVRCGHFSFSELLSSICGCYHQSKLRYLMQKFNKYLLE
jgi:hypothetical protein